MFLDVYMGLVCLLHVFDFDRHCVSYYHCVLSLQFIIKMILMVLVFLSPLLCCLCHHRTGDEASPVPPPASASTPAEERVVLVIDGWIRLEVSTQDAVLLQRARQVCHSLLTHLFYMFYVYTICLEQMHHRYVTMCR